MKSLNQMLNQMLNDFFEIELLPTTYIILKFQPFYIDFLNSPSKRLHVYLLSEP
jgi:DNA mismatch repair ATPase MutL